MGRKERPQPTEAELSILTEPDGINSDPGIIVSDLVDQEVES